MTKERKLTDAEAAALQAEQAEVSKLSAAWRPKVFAAIDSADKSDRTVTDFIFGLVTECGHIDIAERAFIKLETEWQEAHAIKTTATKGPKAGTEITVKPNVPGSWRSLKARVLKACKDAPAVRKAAMSGPVMLAAQKEMKLSQDALSEMYGLEHLDPLNADYAGNFADFNRDLRDAASFVNRFTAKTAAPGLGNGTGGSEEPLPNDVTRALNAITLQTRKALQAGATVQEVNNILNPAINALGKLQETAGKRTQERRLAEQRKDAKSTALASVAKPEAQPAAKAS